MILHTSTSLLHRTTSCQVIPIVESRQQLAQAIEISRSHILLLKHCNILDFSSLLDSAYSNDISIYVNIDYMDGVHADEAGLSYLVQHLHIAGIMTHHPRLLAIGKQLGIQTVQRIFAIDSSGLETTLESVDTQSTDLLAIEPALVIPHIASYLKEILPLPFIGTGLLTAREQVRAVLNAGGVGVATSKSELWPY